MFCIAIIAGGRGERFWPKSTRDTPKQFHKIVTRRTMIQETFYRVFPGIKKENIFIVACPHLKEIILDQLPEIDEGNLIIEPEGKNTAPAIGLAAAWVSRKDPHAVLGILSADHVVSPREEFLKALRNAEEVAREGYIVTFGIEPERPATEYGYIETDGKLADHYDFDVYKVKMFREKPSIEKARRFMTIGNFLWNSGMFIFDVAYFFDAMKQYMPVLYSSLMRIRDSMGSDSESQVKEDEYARFESISIDYGLMEKLKNIACVKPRFLWDDVGSWNALSRHKEKDKQGNVIQGNAVLVESENNIIIAEDGTIVALIGIKDTIVVKEKDRLLVCHTTMDQYVKDALKKLSRENKNQKYL